MSVTALFVSVGFGAVAPPGAVQVETAPVGRLADLRTIYYVS
ncbi:hypothetical protein [Rudaeicoccus suwonensis]|nr:hypothetical protein [Rudaeicoccus suwonensis]